jgi:endoglycosylceramidase
VTNRGLGWRSIGRLGPKSAKWPSLLAGGASLAALLFAASATAAPPGPTPPLNHVGRWITDAQGRVVIVHGLNMVYKLPPYYPSKAGFGADDARFLARNGFDAVRLGVIYKAVEPNPPSGGRPAYDDAYLAKIEKTQRILARQGVFSLVDFHQDLFNEKFQGEGWPDWQVQDDGLPNPENGFPGNYLTNPALNAAFDHFWANDQVGGVNLIDEYAAAWRHVASLFNRVPYVLGYDILNEPWPGNGWQTCAQPAGCPQFDTGPLATMTRIVTKTIRKVDPRHIVWQEPNVLFDFGAPSHLPKIGSNSGFSFHAYCLTAGAADCPTMEALPFSNADDVARTTDRALMLTEFGATDDVTDLNRMAGYADDHMVSWLEWAYCGCGDPTTSGPGDIQAIVRNPKKPPSGKNVFHAKLAALERPYPQAIAGTPKSYGYDTSTHTFTLKYSTKAPNGRRLGKRAPTVIYVPRIHYPHGYDVAVNGDPFVAHGNSRYVLVPNRPGARSATVKIAPRIGQ